MKEKQIAVEYPEWLRDVKNENVSSTVFALMFSWAWDGKPEKIENLREYVASSFDDMTEDGITEVCDLLVKHKIVG